MSRREDEQQYLENNSDISCEVFPQTNHKPTNNNNLHKSHNNLKNSTLDNAELALQFTNLLNNSEKLNFENIELKVKNKELANKVSVQEKGIRELATLLNSIGKINLSLADLQNWLSTESSKRKSLIPNLIEQTPAEPVQPQIIINANSTIMKINDAQDYLKGPLAIIKYLILTLSFGCFLTTILSSSCNDSTSAIRGMYLYLTSSIFLFTFLFWLCMVTKSYRRFLNVNWIFTDCIWSICYSIFLFFGTILLATNTCGIIGLIICLVISVIASGLLLINGLYLYTKIRDFNLLHSNHKKIIWKKTLTSNGFYKNQDQGDCGDKNNDSSFIQI